MTTGANSFIDTNVLMYAAGGKASAPEKHEKALELLAGDFCVSSQVLAEFYVNSIKKGPVPLLREKALLWVRYLAKKTCLPIDERIVQTGIDYSIRYQTSYWDGAIIAAAERLGCKTIYSEDLSHGQTYGEVKVINPFLSGAIL